MTAEPLHNSRALGLFDEILHSAHATMRVVELAGRGIAAEARCHLVLLPADKTPHGDPPAVVYRRAAEFADRVQELCDNEDDLAEHWRRQIEEPDADRFEAALQTVVSRWESWPRYFPDHQVGA